MPTANFRGSGVTLGGTSTVTSQSNNDDALKNVRDRWAKRFEKPTSTETREKKPFSVTGNNSWHEIDDEVQVWQENEVIDLADDDDSVTPMPVKQEKTSPKKRINIHDELRATLDDDIELIDDEFEDALHDKSLELLTDTSVINDIFGDDTLMADFNNSNVHNSTHIRKTEPLEEIIKCPICNQEMERQHLSEHLEGCTGCSVEIKFNSRNSKPLSWVPPKRQSGTKRSSTQTQVKSSVAQKHAQLLAAGYTENDIRRMRLEETEAEAYNRRIQQEMNNEAREQTRGSTATATNDNDVQLVDMLEEQHPCPVCNSLISAISINEHLDTCLNG